MYSDKRTNQGGSVAVFLIVSVLLAAAVIGGIYAVNQRGNQARTAQPVQQQAAPSVAKNDQPTQPSKEQQAADAAKKQKEQEAARKQAEAAKKAAEEKQKQEQAQAAKEQAQKQEQQRVAQNNAQQPTTVPQTGTGHLPTTGPADTFIGLLAAGAMIGIIWAYLRSYKHRFGSLLR